MSLGLYLLVGFIKSFIIINVYLVVFAYTVWAERKVLGHIQNRWGPTKVGPFGLLQPIADGVKLLFKEDMTPPFVYQPIFTIAPVLALVMSLMSVAVIPIAPALHLFGYDIPMQVTDINIGLLFILGVTSIGVYGIALAGWSSNSKYAMLGGLRASAQMISYEASLGLSLIGVLIMSGSFSLQEIVHQQEGFFWGFIPNWNIFRGQFFGFFLYIIAAYAETNRVPFDLPEAESELGGGYHTEYSSMKWSMFFMAEYHNMITVACLATLLFLGGWSGPVIGPPILHTLLPLAWFCLKVAFFLFIYIWVRGTMPRFRYDQLMAFGWKVLLPLAILNVVVTAFFVAWFS